MNSATQKCPNNIYMWALQLKSVKTKYLKLFWLKIFSIAPSLNDTGGAPWAANISANFRKNLKRYNEDEDESWKKPEAKNLVALSLYVGVYICVGEAIGYIGQCYLCMSWSVWCMTGQWSLIDSLLFMTENVSVKLKEFQRGYLDHFGASHSHEKSLYFL